MKPKKKELEREPLPEGAAEIELRWIKRDPKLQVRSKLSEPHIKSLMRLLQTHVELEPVSVANVNGEHILVDGWHRCAAYERLGWQRIRARIITPDEKEVPWLAAQANLRHGLRLSSRDSKKVFRAYVKSGMHRNGAGYKSYREIGRDLGRFHSTIQKWMESMFPSVHRKMSDGAREEPFERTEPEPEEVKRQEHQRTVSQALDGLVRVYQDLDDPRDRGGLIEQIEQELARMKGLGLPVVTSAEDDF